MKAIPLFCASILCVAATMVRADAVKDREGAVRQDKATMENDARWIYNDWRAALAKGKETGKPVLAVLRCVPCLGCMGLDAQVLSESSLVPLLDQFVCVRIINANDLDLQLFQIDGDLSLSALFFNGDGTVYGRYGSWTHQKAREDKDTAGFRRAIEGALALHRGYPANKASLNGKQGGPVAFKTPTQMPHLSGKYRPELDWSGKVVASCVHCHQIADAERVQIREARKPVPDELIYYWPAPETVGLKLAPDHAARVESVAAGSQAAKAGAAPGDDMISLAGQPLVSSADVSWVLHRAPATGTLTAVVRRDGGEKSLTLDLTAGWRQKSDISRRVGTWEMRGMATGGLVLEDLSDAERQRRGLGLAKMALLVKHVGEYGTHAAAKKAGFRNGDIMVGIGEETSRRSEGELIGYLLKNHPAGEKISTTVQRGDARVELILPMQ